MNIGELARRTGLTVKTIRYYSDEGLVPEVSRTPSGYRRYDEAALARLEFVRTLRELGLDLATIRQVLDRQADLAAVAGAHAEALSTRIRLLRVQRAALRAVAGSGRVGAAELARLSRIAQATGDERDRLVTRFLDSIFDFGDGPVHNDFTQMLRRVTPELPDDPSDEQLDAWLELADLLRDVEFRERLRAMGSWMAAASDGSAPDGPMPVGREDAQRLSELVFARVAPLVEADVKPTDAAAAPVVAELVTAYAGAAGRAPTPQYRADLATAARAGHEPRAERYWQLMAVINGWPVPEPRMHLWGWFAEAL